MQTILAKWFYPTRLKSIRLIVVHDMEFPVRDTAAEECARFFANSIRKASAHVAVDTNSAVRCVPDEATAWAAPGANSDGLHIELCGYARFTREEWLSGDNLLVLKQAALVVADWATKYDIPVEHLSVGQVKDGKTRGICGHADVTEAFHESTHTDPGPNFPWPEFLQLVRDALEEDVALSDEDVQRIAEAVWKFKLVADGDWQQSQLGSGWTRSAEDTAINTLAAVNPKK